VQRLERYRDQRIHRDIGVYRTAEYALVRHNRFGGSLDHQVFYNNETNQWYAGLTLDRAVRQLVEGQSPTVDVSGRTLFSFAPFGVPMTAEELDDWHTVLLSYPCRSSFTFGAMTFDFTDRDIYEIFKVMGGLGYVRAWLPARTHDSVLVALGEWKISPRAQFKNEATARARELVSATSSISHIPTPTELDVARMVQTAAYDLGRDRVLPGVVVSNAYSVYVSTVVGFLVAKLLTPIKQVLDLAQFHRTLTEAVVIPNSFREYLARQGAQGRNVGVFPALDGWTAVAGTRMAAQQVYTVSDFYEHFVTLQWPIAFWDLLYPYGFALLRYYLDLNREVVQRFEVQKQGPLSPIHSQQLQRSCQLITELRAMDQRRIGALEVSGVPQAQSSLAVWYEPGRDEWNWVWLAMRRIAVMNGKLYHRGIPPRSPHWQVQIDESPISRAGHIPQWTPL
jgi:hypothetical protein